ncbi:MAG: hypothetical protein JXA96_05515 [Sedimentisphaerales bacterium]|nr:hypothetical protein [Sedimentisphaerales bacterium]
MYKKIILIYIVLVAGTLFLSSSVYGSDENSDKIFELKRLSLKPAAEPIPALSYRLLPRFSEQKNGNAALFYYAATGFYPDEEGIDISEKISDWRNIPFEQLDRMEVERTLSYFSACFHQIELATRRNYCQWEMPIEEGFAMQMPNLAKFRRIIYALELKIQLEIANGNIEQVMKLLQQGMYMGRSIAEGPTLIQGLVGIAIDALMLDEIESFIQRPDAPNFYWALTSLPDPFVSLQRAIQTEREVIFFEFPELRDLENKVLTPEQATKFVTEFLIKLNSLGSPFDEMVPFNNLMPAGFVMIHYYDAKKHLESKGFSNERIEQMPAAQAVMIYQKQQYMEIVDNIYKWFELPYSQVQSRFNEAEKLASKQQNNNGFKTNVFFMIMPAVSRIAFMEARLERDIAMLRTIEAIRMFAANHSGEIPESLADITIVPIPVDPVTGKNFVYKKVDKLNARLEAPKIPENDDKLPAYELSFKK